MVEKEPVKVDLISESILSHGFEGKVLEAMARTTEVTKEMVDAQEKTAVAQERIADALEHIAGNLELVIDAGPAQRHGIRVKKTEN
jgi:hypothetical protein